MPKIVRKQEENEEQKTKEVKAKEVRKKKTIPKVVQAQPEHKPWRNITKIEKTGPRVRWSRGVQLK